MCEVLGNIIALASCSAPTAGETAKWKCIMYNVDKNRAHLCSVLKGKGLFSVLYVTCIPTQNSVERGWHSRALRKS